MTVQRTFGGQLSRAGARFRSIALLAGAAACGGAPTPAPAPAPSPVAAPVSIRPLKVEQPASFTPSVVQLTADSAAALAKVDRASITPHIAPGLELNLWAPEPMIADPIGITFDDQGRMFVTRTRSHRPRRDRHPRRTRTGWFRPSPSRMSRTSARSTRVLAPENSAQNQWLKDWNGDGSRDWRDLTFHKERLYRLEDTNGDGIADFSQIILEDFNDLVSDVAHGVLAYRNDLYLTVSPDIWRLRDTNGDGVIDTKESLAHGSGVHIGFGGHGLSGPIIGPDGRLYWKQGDLGDQHHDARRPRISPIPNSGVILRANPDGTEAEIFASGLRNPQEFAFDEYGNLISPDNDGDHPGEVERLVYIVDGMDSGWRINWQFGKYVDPDNNTYKVWMDEGLFKPRFAGQAAYITPPIAPWHAGPAGFDYNPGTALDDAWRGLLLRLRVHRHAVGLEHPGLHARAAGRRVSPRRGQASCCRDSQVTGVKFGPDGALYLADWIEGWDPKEQRANLEARCRGQRPIARARTETRALIAASFKERSVAELVALLRHADMRVRTKAQFELVDRGAASDLLASARQTRPSARANPRALGNRSARAQGLCAGSSARRFPEGRRSGDPRAGGEADRRSALRRRPDDSSRCSIDPMPRPRFFATEALGRVKYRPAIQPIIEMLAENNDEDVYLRHAGALGARTHWRGRAGRRAGESSDHAPCVSRQSSRCAACTTPASLDS